MKHARGERRICRHYQGVRDPATGDVRAVCPLGQPLASPQYSGVGMVLNWPCFYESLGCVRREFLSADEERAQTADVRQAVLDSLPVAGPRR